VRILLARFGGGNARAGVQPLEGQVHGRVRESRPGGCAPRRLPIPDVAIPGSFEDLLELGGDVFERRIVEPGEKALAKRLFGKRNERVLPPDFGLRHADLSLKRLAEPVARPAAATGFIASLRV
jgi:hypothetical protein